MGEVLAEHDRHLVEARDGPDLCIEIAHVVGGDAAQRLEDDGARQRQDLKRPTQLLDLEDPWRSASHLDIVWCHTADTDSYMEA